MRRARITITLNSGYLDSIDTLIDSNKIRNRSHAIEYIISQFFPSNIRKAVILAGGEGTKLRPYTYEIPKSLLPLKGKPILEYMIDNLKTNGIYDITICTGYLGEKIQQYFGNGTKFGVKLNYSHEKETLQTGGALLKAKKIIGHQPFVLLNGDVIANFNLKDLFLFHQKEGGVVTIALTLVDKPEEYGQLKLHGVRLVDFYQNHQRHEKKSHLINAGIYIVEPDIFEYFPKDTKSFYFEDIIKKLIAKKGVNGFVFEDQWFDVGDSRNYEKAIKEFRVIHH